MHNFHISYALKEFIHNVFASTRNLHDRKVPISFSTLDIENSFSTTLLYDTDPHFYCIDQYRNL